MRNLTRKILLSVAAISAVAAIAVAQTRQFAPRQFNTQQTHYLRFDVSWNSCTLVANTCSVKVGAVPYNAWILRAYQQIQTSFNSATTDTVGIGTSSGGVDLVAAQSVHGAAGGATELTIVAANAGTVKTGAGLAQTGANGGFDIYATFAQTGAAPSAGRASYVIEFAGPNDGSCVAVPMGATAAAC